MELFLRDNDLSDWIELEGGVSLKIAYPSYEQEKEISAAFVGLSLDEKGYDGFVDYYALLVRYCVKDWKGITNIKTGDEIKCVTQNGQLDTGLMAALVRDPMLIAAWGGAIKEKIDFTETDKKK